MQIKFLADYQGVKTEEVFYLEGVVVDVDEAVHPINVPALLKEGRVEVYDGEAVDEPEDDEEDVEDLVALNSDGTALDHYDPETLDHVGAESVSEALPGDVEVDIPVEVEELEEEGVSVEINATPAALELANEHDLSLALIEGSGDEGKVLVGDVRAVIEVLAEGDGSPVELDPEPEVLEEEDGDSGVGAIANTETGGW